MLTGNGTATQVGCTLDVTVLKAKVVDGACAQTGEEVALAVSLDIKFISMSLTREPLANWFSVLTISAKRISWPRLPMV